jgi:hypothetical protein
MPAEPIPLSDDPGNLGLNRDARIGAYYTPEEYMILRPGLLVATLFPCAALFLLPARISPQSPTASPTLAAAAELPEAPIPQAPASGTSSSQQPQSAPNPAQSSAQSTSPAQHAPPPEPKRILGVMPNYRAVSAGVIPPPPKPREAFMVATSNSFDYSAFVFVGITSLLAEGTNAHPQLGKGPGGFWAYYWRGFLDKTDGNYMVDFAFPTVFHQDERYYAMGRGDFVKRSVYAATRIFITPDYHGKNGFNTSEILGRGVSQAISLAYYPSQTQTAGGFTEKFAYALGRDALTNVFREVWPDVSAHLSHRRH